MAVTLSHIEFKEAAWNIISKMMKIDSVLDDLHPQITREEIKALVQLEQGQAISVYIEKDHGPPWKLVVPREATLQQLKAALKTKVKLKLDRNHIPKNISWKYVWRTYWLVFQGTKLEHDNKKLTDYGVSNKSRLNFVKKINFKKSENAEITSSVQI